MLLVSRDQVLSRERESGEKREGKGNERDSCAQDPRSRRKSFIDRPIPVAAPEDVTSARYSRVCLRFCHADVFHRRDSVVTACVK